LDETEEAKMFELKNKMQSINPMVWRKNRKKERAKWCDNRTMEVGKIKTLKMLNFEKKKSNSRFGNWTIQGKKTN
jgi:hypothetical protein